MLKPVGDKVLVRPSEADEITAGGIVLPDTARKKPQTGEVIAVGSGRVLKNGRRVPISVNVGDTVMYSKYAGTKIAVDDEDLMILDEDSIIGVQD